MTIPRPRTLPSLPSLVATAALLPLLAAAPSLAADAITAPETPKAMASFDIVRTEVTVERSSVVFRIRTRGEAGSARPAATGSFAGSAVYSYVWPTTLDSAAVGFDSNQGILALAVTFHPDFDDGAKGAKNRTVWHPHWVVLVKDDQCGPGALKVKDIPEGTKPRLPDTWPGAPLLIDSPDYPTRLGDNSVEVRVPLERIGTAASLAGTVRYDGVTAALRVNANLHAPLLCVADVFDVASGDLSLPGTVR